jgi:hypothetical protein
MSREAIGDRWCMDNKKQIDQRETLLEEKTENDFRLSEIKSELSTTPPHQRGKERYHDLNDERMSLIDANSEITKELRLLADQIRPSADLHLITILVSGLVANPKQEQFNDDQLIDCAEGLLKTIKEKLTQ